MSKKILKKIIKNGNTYEIEGSKLFVITEDLVSVSTDDTKGVAPYNTSYGYTNITISANAGIEWIEGAFYYFEVNTKMVVASANRNVRVRIGTGSYIPVKNRGNSILAGSSYFVKARTDFFVYKTIYESGGALHMNNDTSYSAMSVAEGKTGTATSARVVSADYLKQIIEYHISQNAILKSNTGTQTVSSTDSSQTTPFGIKSNKSGSCYISLSTANGWKGSYGVDDNGNPQFYNGTGHKLAYDEDVSGKLDKVNNSASVDKAYIAGVNGEQKTYNVSQEVSNGAIVRRSGNQIIVPETPTDDSHAASKKYVDEAVAGGGGGDVNIGGVNALIDIKMKEYDSLFKTEDGLYKILNSISDEDELGLTEGDDWEDIVGNATSMSKISHSYSVMCYLANSEYGMGKVVESAIGCKEISECWNSISIISDCETASDLYLGSEYGVENLLKYATAQDAFFDDLVIKSRIISQNIMTIVNDDELLEYWYNDSIVAGCIANNSTAIETISGDDNKLGIVIDNNTITTAISNNTNCLVDIAGDSDKLEIVKNNSIIMNKLVVNSSALNSMSKADFFEYVLENATYLNTCAGNNNGKSKINSFTADELLEPIYYWTGDLGYNSFTDLVSDSDKLLIVAGNSNAMLIIMSNTECSNAFPLYKGGTFNYTGSDQQATDLLGTYKIECWGAGGRSAKGGYACGIFTFSEFTDVSVMVGATGNNGNGTKYGFGGSANGGSNASGGGLSGVFIGTGTILATDRARALIIGGGAGGNSAGTGGAGGGETGGTGSGSFGTAGGGGTQTGRGSGGNAGASQFNGGNGSGTYGYGGGGGWWGGNSSIGDGSGDDDKGGGGGSGYVSTSYSMTGKVLTQGGGSNAGANGKVVITRM